MSDEAEQGVRAVAPPEPEVTAEILDRLESLPEDSRREMMAVLYQHRGPLPDPATFAAYGQIYPDAPREILAMAKNQHDHDIAMASQAMTSETSYRRETLAAATIVFLAIVAAATALGITGHDVAASVMGGTGGLVVAAGALLRGRDLFPRSEPTEPTPPPPGVPATVQPPPVTRPNRHQPRGRR